MFSTTSNSLSPLISGLKLIVVIIITSLVILAALVFITLSLRTLTKALLPLDLKKGKLEKFNANLAAVKKMQRLYIFLVSILK